MAGAGGRYVGPISSERTQLLLRGFLPRFRTDETLRTNPGATRYVRSLSRYVPDSDFTPFPTRFAFASGYIQLLRTWNLLPEPPRQSALNCTPHVSSSVFVVVQLTTTSSPFSVFRLLAPSLQLRFPRLIRHLDGFDDCFPMHSRACWTTSDFTSDQPSHRNRTRDALTPLWCPLAMDLDVQNIYGILLTLAFRCAYSRGDSSNTQLRTT